MKEPWGLRKKIHTVTLVLKNNSYICQWIILVPHPQCHCKTCSFMATRIVSVEAGCKEVVRLSA